MRLGRRTKDPDANPTTFSADWTAWLAKRGNDTIATSDWIVPTTPDTGMTRDSQTAGAQTTTFRCLGGTLGSVYEWINRITTVGGLKEDGILEVFITND